MSEIQSLARGLKILDILERSQDGASITELAGILGVDKGSASRLVSTLARYGYAGKDEVTRRYHLGPCDAMQVFDFRYKMVGSIGISGPATLISPGCLLELDAILVEVGKVLSERTAFTR